LIFARTGNTVSSNAIGQKRFTFRQMFRLTKCTLQIHWVISLFGSILGNYLQHGCHLEIGQKWLRLTV